MESAKLTRLDSIVVNMVGNKLRVAGQVLAISPYTGIIILRAGAAALLVDASSCFPPAVEWSREWLCTVSIVGYLELTPPGLDLPRMPRRACPNLDSELILGAILVEAQPGLNLETWNKGLEAIAGAPKLEDGVGKFAS
ncbi:hypothetical protein DFH06DRAFT_1327188 [Mycena polygramma]|nr:hypothetical protein DFH06DRAFT_1327188 [Mycena polygramma]